LFSRSPGDPTLEITKGKEINFHINNVASYRCYDVHIEIQLNLQTTKIIKRVKNFYWMQYQCTEINSISMLYYTVWIFKRNLYNFIGR
jgi:hypothetical protein